MSSGCRLFSIAPRPEVLAVGAVEVAVRGDNMTLPASRGVAAQSHTRELMAQFVRWLIKKSTPIYRPGVDSPRRNVSLIQRLEIIAGAAIGASIVGQVLEGCSWFNPAVRVALQGHTRNRTLVFFMAIPRYRLVVISQLVIICGSFSSSSRPAAPG